MNILMMTNTYTPIVGGLERSIQNFTDEYRKLGHCVIIVAPEFKNQPKRERDVIRIPSIQNFNGTDFSINVPIPELVFQRLKQIKPDVIHAHHPFLMGDMALRLAAQFEAPLVFTYHTLYEQYLNHWFHDPKRFKRFVISLAIGYSNLADQVFAPSQSIYDMLRNRGVQTPIAVLPTGIYIESFEKGDGKRIRKRLGISPNAFVVGHAGRLSPEKNLNYLVKSVIQFMKKNPPAEFLLVGKGESEPEIKKIFQKEGLAPRLREAGLLKGEKLADAYHAMDVFVFTSKSETQGLVLLEAMACGTPVIATDAPGARDVIRDFKNGRLIQAENEVLFSSVLRWFSQLRHAQKQQLKAEARRTALTYAMPEVAKQALVFYQKMLRRKAGPNFGPGTNFWEKAMHRMSAEWGLLKNVIRATGAALIQKQS